MSALKFGVMMFGIAPRHYGDVGVAAEANGFESMWMPEHLVLPEQIPPTYLYSESGFPPITSDTPTFDPWVVLGAVAQVTSKIRLATNVYILPLRHPIQVARSLVTLDRLSNGRVTLGMGVGWLEEEFQAAGQSWKDRGARADDMIGLLRRLWTDDVIEHHSPHFDIRPVKFQPKPVQKSGIPIEVGGASKPALRRAARLGDGWVEIGSTDEDTFTANLAFIQAERKAAGRENEPFEVTANFGAGIEGAKRAQDLGVTRVLIGPSPEFGARVTVELYSDWAKRYADEVISKF